MIISRAEIESAVAVYRASLKRVARTASTAEVVEIATADSFSASEEASTLNALREQVIDRPYYRENLVKSLKRRIEEGNYFVPTEQIVEKMLGRLIVENLGSA